MTLTLNNTNTLTADNIVVGGTNLSDLYAIMLIQMQEEVSHKRILIIQ